MAFLLGNNAIEASTKGMSNGVARYWTTGYVAGTTGTVTSAFIYAADWAGQTTSRVKVVVFNSGGTQLGISDAITIPATTPGWASASFASSFGVTSGQTYYLAAVVNSGTVDSYDDATTFACTDCGGTYTYTDPSGSTLSGSTANAGEFSLYLDGTTGGSDTGLAWLRA